MNYSFVVPLQSAELIFEFTSKYELARSPDQGDLPMAVSQAFGYVRVSVFEPNPSDPLALTIKKQAVSKSKFEELIEENRLVIAKLYSIVGQLDTQIAIHTVEFDKHDPSSNDYRRLENKKSQIVNVKLNLERRLYAHNAFTDLNIRHMNKRDSVKFAL